MVELINKNGNVDLQSPQIVVEGNEGGTANYNELENKPSINGIELTGNQSLSALGIQSVEDSPRVFYIKATKNEENKVVLDTDFNIIIDRINKGYTPLMKYKYAEKEKELTYWLDEANINPTGLSMLTFIYQTFYVNNTQKYAIICASNGMVVATKMDRPELNTINKKKPVQGDLTLTAEDVGALASTTTALPNPNPLTFTGAATGVYDGSTPLTINIPAGGGGGSVNSGIPFYNRYAEDADRALETGYTKTSISTTNLPTEVDKKWGILFFIAENAEEGTGTQTYYPIDGNMIGTIWTRSIVRGKKGNAIRSQWVRLATMKDIENAMKQK